MKRKIKILFFPFAIAQVAICIGTPNWFADALVYTNDALLFALLLFNTNTLLKSGNRYVGLFVVIQTLCIVESLLLFQADDCDGTLFMRFEYFSWQLFNYRPPVLSDHQSSHVFLGDVGILLIIAFLEYLFIRASKRNPGQSHPDHRKIDE